MTLSKQMGHLMRTGSELKESSSGLGLGATLERLGPAAGLSSGISITSFRRNAFGFGSANVELKSIVSMTGGIRIIESSSPSTSIGVGCCWGYCWIVPETLAPDTPTRTLISIVVAGPSTGDWERVIDMFKSAESLENSIIRLWLREPLESDWSVELIETSVRRREGRQGSCQNQKLRLYPLLLLANPLVEALVIGNLLLLICQNPKIRSRNRVFGGLFLRETNPKRMRRSWRCYDCESR